MITTLSQRLRDMYQEMRRHSDTIPGWDTNLFFEAIAKAEAQEAQAGELSDEVIEELAQGRILATSSGQVACIDGGQESDVHGFADGLRYARDHYLRPSQAISEQTPVAWRNVRRIDLRIPVRLNNAMASLAMDTIGAIVDHLGVKVNDDRDGTYWRLRTALMKMRGVGRSSAIEGASAIMEAMDRPSPITPEARDRAIEALDEMLDYVGRDCDHIDHNGNCQTHGVQPVDECLANKARQALSALRGS